MYGVFILTSTELGIVFESEKANKQTSVDMKIVLLPWKVRDGFILLLYSP